MNLTTEVQKDTANNSIAKAVAILNCFSYEKPRLRLKDIVALTGINQTTAFRMLSSLKEFGFIEQREGTYALGTGFLRYEGIVLHSMEVRRVSLPFIDELSNTFKVSVSLAIRDGYEVVYVGRSETAFFAYSYVHIGMRRPAYCTALGKVLLCQQPEIVHEMYKRPIDRFTRNTITDEAQFVRELEQVRLQGYAVDREEGNNGMNCIAAPLFGPAGEVVAGISITTSTSTHQFDQMLDYVPPLLDYARRISARLGWTN